MKLRIVPNRRNWIVTTAVPPGNRRALGNRERELAADQEPGRLTVERHQVRLGQDLGHRVLRRALMNSEKWPASKTPKSVRRRCWRCPAVALRCRVDRRQEADGIVGRRAMTGRGRSPDPRRCRRSTTR